MLESALHIINVAAEMADTLTGGAQMKTKNILIGMIFLLTAQVVFAGKLAPSNDPNLSTTESVKALHLDGKSGSIAASMPTVFKLLNKMTPDENKPQVNNGISGVAHGGIKKVQFEKEQSENGTDSSNANSNNNGQR